MVSFEYAEVVFDQDSFVLRTTNPETLQVISEELNRFSEKNQLNNECSIDLDTDGQPYLIRATVRETIEGKRGVYGAAFSFGWAILRKLGRTGWEPFGRLWDTTLSFDSVAFGRARLESYLCLRRRLED